MIISTGLRIVDAARRRRMYLTGSPPSWVAFPACAARTSSPYFSNNSLSVSCPGGLICFVARNPYTRSGSIFVVPHPHVSGVPARGRW